MKKVVLTVISFIIFLLDVIYAKVLLNKNTTTLNCNPKINKLYQCDVEQCNVLLICVPNNTTPLSVESCKNETPYCTVGRYYDYCSDNVESTSYACDKNKEFPCSKPGFYPGM